MTRDLFDRKLRVLRRDRAARMGAELFLYNRAFDDCLDRLQDIARPFRHALLIGCPSPDWPDRLRQFADAVDVLDPGSCFAQETGGLQVEEDRHDFGEDRYDLCVAVGTLDTVNDLPLALRLMSRALRDDAPLLGAIAGGNSLSTLRASLIEAGRTTGRIVGRTHPRIDPSSLARLLSDAGFSMPVVDVDRVKLRYVDLDALVRDLRAMGVNAALADRPPPFLKSEATKLRQAFAAAQSDGRTEEIVEILHFLGWRK